tara:strand:- start:448 stop:645 length:198 start_codon:yes stop_codon:yes gene_type:complete
MDAWRNARDIGDLREAVEKQMIEFKTKFAALYKYMEMIDQRTQNCSPDSAKKALKSVTKKTKEKK